MEVKITNKYLPKFKYWPHRLMGIPACTVTVNLPRAKTINAWDFQWGAIKILDDGDIQVKLVQGPYDPNSYADLDSARDPHWVGRDPGI